MVNQTLREKYIAGLIKLGESEAKCTNKWIVYSRKAGGFFYLGKSGSLRFGNTVATSLPVSQKFKDMLIAEGII